MRLTYDPLQNSLVEIALVGAALGVCAGTSLTLIAFSYCPNIPVYVLLVVAYYLTEFSSSAVSQPSRVHLRAFLIYGNRGSIAFWTMHIFLWIDFYCGLLRVPHYMQVCGVFLACTGIILRSMAMHTCGESFAHIIETERTPRSQLVTQGVYSWSRHPSYLGFWCFAVGTLLALGSLLSVLAAVAALAFFFRIRIRYEEHFLRKMYGTAYLEYQARVGIYIPGV